MRLAGDARTTPSLFIRIAHTDAVSAVSGTDAWHDARVPDDLLDALCVLDAGVAQGAPAREAVGVADEALGGAHEPVSFGPQAPAEGLHVPRACRCPPRYVRFPTRPGGRRGRGSWRRWSVRGGRRRTGRRRPPAVPGRSRRGARRGLAQRVDVGGAQIVVELQDGCRGGEIVAVRLGVPVRTLSPAANGGDQSSDLVGWGSSGVLVASVSARRPPFSSGT